jgi:hypothetical protein
VIEIITQKEVISLEEWNKADIAAIKELGVLDGYSHICTIALECKDENPAAKQRRKDVINYIKMKVLFLKWAGSKCR